ncbi:NADH-quinone oxidoreductase subunit C [bacterium]|nr:NADH-quinone oxidoreductase subunit C [bacterium]
MTFQDVQNKLQSQLSSSILGVEDVKPDPSLKIAPRDIVTVVQFMKDHLQFETLGDLCGVDYPAQSSFCVVYHLQSYTHKMVVRLKCYLPREDGAEMPSLTSIFKAANWLEREVFDMIGVRFTGHPEMRRILCPEDWQGHPLRKDYVTPDYYNGMPVPLFFEDQTTVTSGETHS